MVVYLGNIKMIRLMLTFVELIEWQRSIWKCSYGLRYTSSKDGKWIYAFLLIWPKYATEIILSAPLPTSNTVVTLLGSTVGSLQWSMAMGDGGIVIDVSNIRLHSLRSNWIWVFKLENVLPNDSALTSPTTTAPSTTLFCFVHQQIWVIIGWDKWAVLHETVNWFIIKMFHQISDYH